MKALVKPARDVHRAHELERVGEAEDGAHEDGVLVGRDVVDEGVALPDRLGEGRRQAARQERREEPERERRLAAVHARRGQVHLSHRPHRTAQARAMACARLAGRSRLSIDGS